ncbi:MAG: RNA polymerase sigma factor [Planctomycetaceae bacterium]|nr:RNA polymerase sigma factor [Planctomycetaceae bacterium]
MAITTEECKNVVCQNYKEIYRFVLYLTGNTAQTEDLTQDIFLSAWSNADTFKAKSSVKTWLYKIAYNKFIDSARKSKRQISLLERYEEYRDKNSCDINPLSKVLADEESRCLYDAMRKLDMPDYTNIVLHYIEGLTFCEIAEILDRPVGTVKWQINQTMKKLKELLAK